MRLLAAGQAPPTPANHLQPTDLAFTQISPPSSAGHANVAKLDRRPAVLGCAPKCGEIETHPAELLAAFGKKPSILSYEIPRNRKALTRRKARPADVA